MIPLDVDFDWCERCLLKSLRTKHGTPLQRVCGRCGSFGRLWNFPAILPDYDELIPLADLARDAILRRS